MQRIIHAAEAIYTISIFFVPPGTHYCWVARGNIDSNLAQGFIVMSSVPEIVTQTSFALRPNTLPLSHARTPILFYKHKLIEVVYGRHMC